MLEYHIFYRQLAYHALEGDLKNKDLELRELQEFTKLECDLKDQSLMEKREKVHLLIFKINNENGFYLADDTIF